jgi:lipoyl(octanoyl) transferase
MAEVLFRDLGIMDYKETWDYQEELFGKWIEYKRKAGQEVSGGQGSQEGQGSEERQGSEGIREEQSYPAEPGDPPVQYLLFVEHPHVYTLGKSGDETNMLIHKEFLKKINATYYKINRGGDITYHGPGQIVGYPILDLESHRMGLRSYIGFLEESIIELCRSYGIEATQSSEATGVWIDEDHPHKARKICAIGVRTSRYVTMHGFAFNVNTDLDYFTYINPCGFQERGVTSMEKELGKKMDMEQVKSELKEILLNRLNTER